LLVVGLLALVAASPAVAQVVASYEAPGTYKPADVLPKELTRGPRWEVQNPVVADGYMFRFKVRSDYGMFDAAGTGALRKLIGEIAAIGKLKEISLTAVRAAP
jgi:hypothetical protein